MTETTTENLLREEVRANWPSLSFHYGLSFDDLRAMPRWARELYVDSLPRILASQQLRSIEAAAYVWQSAERQRDIMNRLRASMPKSVQQVAATPRTKEELQLLTAASGIGIVFEKKPEEVTPSA